MLHHSIIHSSSTHTLSVSTSSNHTPSASQSTFSLPVLLPPTLNPSTFSTDINSTDTSTTHMLSTHTPFPHHQLPPCTLSQHGYTPSSFPLYTLLVLSTPLCYSTLPRPFLAFHLDVLTPHCLISTFIPRRSFASFIPVHDYVFPSTSANLRHIHGWVVAVDGEEHSPLLSCLSVWIRLCRTSQTASSASVCSSFWVHVWGHSFSCLFFIMDY